MQRRIRKAVFPVAGLGTRFLPATKAIPKEMLPIVDRPLIELAVAEASDAGIEHFIFVTGRNKTAIEDHFDRQFELESVLLSKGRTAEIALLEAGLPPAGRTCFTRQQVPLGLGHAIWCARDIVGDEPFAVLLPDMVMHAEPGCLSQMIEVYEARGGGNVIAVEAVSPDLVHRYGVVGCHEHVGNSFIINAMVEKPKREDAPSNLIISGRYILQPEIFAEIEDSSPGAGNEIQITDAMIRLMARQPFLGLEFHGKTYDCGDKVGFLAANVAYGLDHAIVGEPFRKELADIVRAHGGTLEWPDEPPQA